MTYTVPSLEAAAGPGGSTTQAPAVSVAGLTKSYESSPVLRGLDLTVSPGSVYALLGPNGAGKTTLVRILTTLLRPDSGAVEVAGVDVLRRPGAARTVIGLVGQHAALDEVLTGRQNLELFGRLFHLGASAARRRAVELLDAFTLTEAADRPVSGYSGGMRRRLDLAAGLVLRPPVLFLDEPTTGLDPRGRAEVWDAVRALVADGTTVLLTTQYLDEADRLATRVGILDSGRIVAEGTPAELKRGLGADRVEVVLTDAGRLDEARDLLVSTLGLAVADVRTDRPRATVSVPAPDGLPALAAVTAALTSVVPALVTDDVALRRPSLDDVFLSLTGAPVSSTGTTSQEA